MLIHVLSFIRKDEYFFIYLQSYYIQINKVNRDQHNIKEKVHFIKDHTMSKQNKKEGNISLRLADGSQPSVSGQSSTGSRGSAFGALQSTYQDDTKLRAAIKLYSTLETVGAEGIGGGSSSLDNDTNSLMSAGLGGGGSNPYSDNSYKKLDNRMGRGTQSYIARLIRLEKNILQRLFQINHVVLSNQAVSVPFFHLVIFLSFVQILFNIFYKVEVTNEFNLLPVLVTVTSNTTLLNGTIVQNGTYIDYVPSTFRVDTFFEFINFQFYVMQGKTESNFIMMYAILCCIFLLFLILLFSFSGEVFEQAKMDDIKDRTKIIIKVVSILMCLFLFLLQMPMITLFFQGYLCNESSGDELVVSGITCGSLQHNLLIVFSTIMIILYVAFLIFEQVLYSSNSLESTLPWSSFEKTLSMVRVSIKVLIAGGFAFDKEGIYRGQLNLACFAIQLYIVVQRYMGALFFKTSVSMAMVLYESQALWFYATISIHILSDSQLTVTSFTVMVVTGLFFSLTIVHFHRIKKDECLCTKDSYLEFNSAQQYMVYFQRIYQVIEGNKPEFNVLLTGNLYHHFQICETKGCKCEDLIYKYDKIEEKKRVFDNFIKETIIDNSMRHLSTRFEMDKVSNENNQSNAQIQGQQIPPDLGTISFRSSANKAFTGISQNNTRTKIQPEMPNVEDVSECIAVPLSSVAHRSESTARQRITATQNEMLLPKDFDEESFGGEKSNGLNDRLFQRFNVDSYVLSKNRKIKLEQRFNELLETREDQEDLKKQRYIYLSILIQESIEKFPDHVDLRIINAYIQKAKLNNEFKAIFEMMNCELCKPTFYEQFVIFRKKIEIEQTLIKQHHRNIEKIGMLDVMQVFKYEKQVSQKWK